MSVVEFLLARIAEDEAVAQAVGSDAWESHFDGTWGNLFEYHERNDPARVLAECEAKRRIVAQYEAAVVASAEETDTEAGWIKDGVEKALATTIRALALPYADHPDCREEWKP